MIVDHHGNPIDFGTLREPQTTHLSALRREWEGHPARGLTPQRLAAVLQRGEQGELLDQLDLADDMEERDSHVFAQLQTRKLAIVSLDWELEPPKNASAAEKKSTEALAEAMEQLPNFEDVVQDMLDGVLKGYAAHELVWRMEDGWRLPMELHARPQRWLTLSKEDRSTFLLRDGMSEGVALQPLGWMVHRHASRSGYPARQALLRVLAWPYLFKNFAVRDLAEMLEIYGLPIRMGKYPTGASDDEKRRLLQAVVSLGHNAAGIMPMGMEIEFQRAAEGNDGPFKTLISYMDDSISRAVLGQTLTSGEGNSGSQALGKVHNEVRKDILKADVRQLEGTLTEQLIKPIGLLNIPGFDPKRCPRLRFDVVESEDLATFATALPGLVNAGVKVPVEWVHERLRIPQPQEGEAVLEAKAVPGPAAGADGANPSTTKPVVDQKPGSVSDKPVEPNAAQPASSAPAPANAALSGGLPPPPVRDALDDLVDSALGDWEPVMGAMVGPLMAEIRKAVADGESIEAFRARVPALAKRLDGVPLAELVARANFIARLAGTADLELRPGAQDLNPAP